MEIYGAISMLGDAFFQTECVHLRFDLSTPDGGWTSDDISTRGNSNNKLNKDCPVRDSQLRLIIVEYNLEILHVRYRSKVKGKVSANMESTFLTITVAPITV